MNILRDEELYQKGYAIPKINYPDKIEEWKSGTDAIYFRRIAEAAHRETLKMVGEKFTRFQQGRPEPKAASEHPYEPSYLMMDVKDWQTLNQSGEE